MKLITPSYLKKGDTIAIVAPAGILINREKIIRKAIKLVESWGLNVVIGNHVFAKGNHFAGTDEQRGKDFQDALDTPKIKAILCARGGYGSVRILDRLDFTKFYIAPKWIIGYSDVTAFHCHIHKLGVETLHAMMGTCMQDDIEIIRDTVTSLKKALFGKKIEYRILSNNYNRLGEVNGQLVGGNITLLTSMLGSVSQISTENKILFIEEIGEYMYAIDRMLQSLKRAGYFKNVNGVIVGGMTKIKNNVTSWGGTIEELILDIVPNNIPIIFDFPAGHNPDNRALIMGRNVSLNIDRKQSSIIFDD